jgi:hypothetical protein
MGRSNIPQIVKLHRFLVLTVGLMAALYRACMSWDHLRFKCTLRTMKVKFLTRSMFANLFCGGVKTFAVLNVVERRTQIWAGNLFEHTKRWLECDTHSHVRFRLCHQLPAILCSYFACAGKMWEFNWRATIKKPANGKAAAAKIYGHVLVNNQVHGKNVSLFV